MYQFVMLVHFEYEGVVDVVASEDLDGKSSAEKDKANHCCELIRVHSRVNLVPIWITGSTWCDWEEDKEWGKDEKTAAKEGDQVRISTPDVIVLSIELHSGLSFATLAEAVCVEGEQVFRKDLQLSCHFSFFHLEWLLRDNLENLLVHSIVL